MFKIVKSEPNFFTTAKKKIKLPKTSSAWSSSEITTIRPELRKYILSEEQNSLCAYCEKEIDDNSSNSNIDHFELKSIFPQKTLEYDNLLVSCNTSNRCSNYKDTHIKNKNDYGKIVNPINENPDDFFDYLLTGEIFAIASNQKAEFTIDIFQLGREQDEPLSRERKQLANTLKYLPNLSLVEINNQLGNEFCSFVKIIYKKL